MGRGHECARDAAEVGPRVRSDAAPTILVRGFEGVGDVAGDGEGVGNGWALRLATRSRRASGSAS